MENYAAAFTGDLNQYIKFIVALAYDCAYGLGQVFETAKGTRSHFLGSPLYFKTTTKKMRTNPELYNLRAL